MLVKCSKPREHEAYQIFPYIQHASLCFFCFHSFYTHLMTFWNSVSTNSETFGDCAFARFDSEEEDKSNMSVPAAVAAGDVDSVLRRRLESILQLLPVSRAFERSRESTSMYKQQAARYRRNETCIRTILSQDTRSFQFLPPSNYLLFLCSSRHSLETFRGNCSSKT